MCIEAHQTSKAPPAKSPLFNSLTVSTGDDSRDLGRRGWGWGDFFHRGPMPEKCGLDVCVLFARGPSHVAQGSTWLSWVRVPV